MFNPYKLRELTLVNRLVLTPAPRYSASDGLPDETHAAQLDRLALAGFLSPLTNQCDDDYGGSLENRLRFPLELFAAVRAIWPEDKPLAVALNVTDFVTGGFDQDEAVTVAQTLRAHGCDLIEILAGQTTPEANPAYQPGFLTP